MIRPVRAGIRLAVSPRHWWPLGLLLVLLIPSAAGSAFARSPNIVLILADDLGFSDTAPYGSEISTPNISVLANEGIRFSNYHTSASCAPTRGMLLTGVDSHRNGVPNIPESIPAAQSKYSHYRGTLNHNVVTVATLLRDSGYHTYMAGKWHLGQTRELLPSSRGFERTTAMADTGADNWEMKPYLPIYEKANWFEDGEVLRSLPDDFYSSKYFVDRSIEYIESNRGDNKPFFAYIPFQAVHIPVQAPREFTQKYSGVYDDGWSVLRKRRLTEAVSLGIVPADSGLAEVSTTRDWGALSEEDQQYQSKRMAVYGGMVEAMDHHIGRLMQYLRETNQYDDTVFIFLSDNGSEGSDPIDVPGGALMKLWFRSNGYDTDYDNLGLRGSFVVIGPSFASAAASPLAYYKFFAREGGMRVPLIIAGKPVAEPGSISNAFAFVTDLAPTILEIAGIDPPGENYAGRRVERIVGRSLLPLTEGRVDRVHRREEATGYELGGNAALFKGDYKIVLDRRPAGDEVWHLYDIVRDPGESKDLRTEMPKRFAEMMNDYLAYVERNNVLSVPAGYDQRKQVAIYGFRSRGGPVFVARLGAGIALILVGLVAWRMRRR